MTSTTAVSLLSFSVLVVLVLLAFTAKLFLMLRELSTRFASLGFVVREDAKRYFDDAAAKIVDTNLNFRESYVQIVEEGTVNALSQTAQTVEGSIVAAQREANQIILRARDDARRINVESRKMAMDEMSRSLGNAADTISWVLEQYVHETFTIEKHKYVIDKLVAEYLDEYKN